MPRGHGLQDPAASYFRARLNETCTGDRGFSGTWAHLREQLIEKILPASCSSSRYADEGCTAALSPIYGGLKEMTLQLAMQWFPQVFSGGTMQSFVVPVPWKAAVVVTS